MRMVDVLMMTANGEIEKGTMLEIGNKIYTYTDEIAESDCSFVRQEYGDCVLLEDEELITEKFLNLEAKLMPPKQKKYSIKLNIRGLNKVDSYVNYKVSNIDPVIILSNDQPTISWKTQFTKQEMKEIKAIREFLEDVDGKYELVGVDSDEDD